MFQQGGGTVTDIDGNYSVTTDDNATLTFSLLGYADVQEPVKSRARIDVVMKEDVNFLDEVIVMGYTTQKKNELSSSVVSLKSEEILDNSTPDLGNMLQGKAAGVVVMNSSGMPGDTSLVRYNRIKPRHIPREEQKGAPKEQYDLSLQYSTRVDTLSAVAARIVDYRDSIRNNRENYIGKKDTAAEAGKKDNNQSSFEKMGHLMVRDYSFDLKDLGQLHIAPLVSPLLFDYSTSRGLSYNQKLRLSRVTSTDKLYIFEPRIGYNFKYKELYWGVKGEVNYAPRRMSRIFFDVGNGNKFAARNGIAVDTSGGKRNEFRALHARVGHKIEVANGFTISTNIALHRYSQIEKHSNFYSTFVPELEFQYTPKQYYYMNGERKVYLYSPCPTFTLNFAHSFKGVMGSTTRFNKVEFDMQQKLRVGPMHSLHYRVGFGLFYDYSDLYFAEFNNLKRNNLPEGWDDDIGGTFHLLSTVKYNEIDKYLRANIKYDAPLLLVPSLLRKMKYIGHERLYCNLLLVDTMDPYIEMGYGIGTNIFNVGLFWGGEITKWDMVGVKFTFEVQ